MPSKPSRKEIREEGLRVIQDHLRRVENPSRLVLVEHPKVGKTRAYWSIDLDGQMLCYIGVGLNKGHAIITFEVETKDGIGTFQGAWRYGSFEEYTDSDVQEALEAAGSDDLLADRIRKRRLEIVGR